MMRVGLFFGGPSSEREVSLDSGRHVYNSLDRSKYEVTPIFVDLDLKFWEITERLIWMNSTSDIAKCLEEEGTNIKYEELKERFDFCFLGLHGKYVEDGAMQGLLEILDLPYNGPRIIGAAIGMDKIFQKQLLKAEGITYAPHVTVALSDYKADGKAIEDKIEKELGFPCVVKPSREGCSTGISKVNQRADLASALEEAHRWDYDVLVEKFLPFMEVTCTIMGNEHPEALLPTETPSKGDFLTLEEKFLPGDAQMITPPRVPKEEVKTMQNEFVKAYKAMCLKVYSRIDGFWDTNNKVLYINEPNTLPGITPSTHVFHQAAEAGMSASDFLDKVIAYSLDAREFIGSEYKRD